MAQDEKQGLVTAKAVAMVVLGGASVVLGLLPLLLSRVGRGRRVGGGRWAALAISLLLAFGGGALLCTTFLHLLPEVREVVEALQEAGALAETRFPLAELVMCAGFFAMYLVEELVHVYLHHRRRRAVQCGPGAQTADSALHRSLSKRRCSRADASCPPGAQQADDAAAVPSAVVVSTAEEKQLTNGGGGAWADANGNHPAKHVHQGQAHVHVHLDVGDAGGDDSVLSSLRGLLIVLALSVHELFEGLAVGLQETATMVYYMMGAVAAHKLVLAFCVGVQLLAAGTRTRFVVCYVLTFALVSPIGIGIGLALGTEEGSSVNTSAATATLQGLACGTLLYVVFFEILQKEAKGIRQYFSTAAGFLIMFAVLVATSEEHDHSHGHSHSHEHAHDHEEAAGLALSAVTDAVTDAVAGLVAR